MQLLKRREVAELLRVSTATLRHWHTAGIGPPAIRVGPQQYRYREHDVLDWLEQQEKSDV